MIYNWSRPNDVGAIYNGKKQRWEKANQAMKVMKMN
jgi:hypothetical protein